MERRSQGTRAGSQEGQWSPQVPGVTNRGSAPRGERATHRGPSSVKGWSAHPAGPREQLRRRLWQRLGRRGLRGPQEQRFQRRRPRSPGRRGTQPRIRRSPRDRRRPGGHRTARTLLPPGAPELCRSAPPAPGASRPLRTGSCGSYCGS